MKVVSRYCDSCGVKIPAQDIEDEVALKYEDSYYCKECKTEILPLIEKDKKAGGNGATPAGKAVSKAAKAGAAAGAAAGAKKAPSKEGPPAKEQKSAGAGAPKITSGARPAVPGAAGKAPSGTRPAVGAAAKPGASKPGAAARPGLAAKKPISRRPADEEEPEDSEGGSEEEMDASLAPRKNKMLLPALVGGGVLLAIVLVWAFSGAGGTSGATEASVAKKTPQQVAREKSQKIWRDAVAAVKDKPAGEQIRVLNGVIQSGAILDQSVMDEAEKKLEDMQEAYKARGKEEFDKLYARAKALADQEKYEEAITTLRNFDDELRETPWYLRNVRAEIERLERLSLAKSEAEPLLKKAAEYAAQKEWMLAAGVLEGFDGEEHRQSPFAARVAQYLKHYVDAASGSEIEGLLEQMRKDEEARKAAELAEKKRKQEEEDRRIASLNWTSIPTDDLFTWKLPEPKPAESWKPSGKELVGKCGGALPNMQIGAAAGCGDRRWIDFIVEFKYKVVKGGFRVGARALADRWVELSPAIQADGQYHTMTISVRGTDDDAFQEILPDGTKRQVKFDAHDSTQGGIAFCLLPDSECVFTEVRIKVINKET